MRKLIWRRLRFSMKTLDITMTEKWYVISFSSLFSFFHESCSCLIVLFNSMILLHQSWCPELDTSIIVDDGAAPDTENKGDERDEEDSAANGFGDFIFVFC